MKYIIVGLGNFGSSLAEKLTAQGNEVIGVDSRADRVETYKEKISHTIHMDATDESAVSGLPLKDTDTVIIGIGENQGSNVMATALFKNLGVKRLISRAIDSLHEKVLMAIGVDEIVHPEEETAERWAKKLSLKGVVDSFELSKDYSLIETRVPKDYIDKTIGDVELRKKFGVLVLTIIKQSEVKSLLGKSRKESKVQGVASAETKMEEDDILVLFGRDKNLKKFLKEEKE
ncbi:MAG: TrkA family potassium uptake protein [Brumimicrobium sp.]|nr:TrkA family potassium uptake protein [Brumimicrobium sp.]